MDAYFAQSAHRLTQVEQTQQRTQREAALGLLWRGQSYDTLLKSLGPPKLVLNIPGERPQPTLALVYGFIDQAIQCFDTFTLVNRSDTGQWLVADYFCR